MQYKILIIDDNHEFVISLRNLLVDVIGIQSKNIHFSFDGADGLMMIQENDYDYDYVFIDINIPYIDGISAIRFIRYDFYKPDLKIIAISLNAGNYYKKEMLQAGANLFLSKDEIDADKILEIFNSNIINENNHV